MYRREGGREGGLVPKGARQAQKGESDRQTPPTSHGLT